MKGPSATALAFCPTPGATYKLIYLARRRSGMPAEAFPEAWRAHSRLASTFATSLGTHFRSSRQCVVDPADGPDPLFTNDHDGSTILTLKSWPDLLAARYHPKALDELLADEKRVFAGAVDDWTMAAEETLLRDDVATDHVLLSFLTPLTGLGAARFAEQSLKLSQRLVAVARGARRIVWNRVVDPAPAFAFAAVTELWFADRDAMIAAAHSYPVRDVLAHTGAADLGRSVHLRARLNLAKTTTGTVGASGWSEAS